MEKVAKKVLSILNKNGYKAYIVGGFVRDYLLHKESTDIDICTSALPEEIIKLFPKYVSYDYGVVKYSYGRYNIEIASMRRELEYSNRRPIKVEYVDNIEKDYLRRDFTINSLYMDINENIIDPCHGLDDLNNRVISVVGNPDKKFQEDSLRILRAIRFASKLNFNIENNTKIAIVTNKEEILNLSDNRISEELLQILNPNSFQIGLKLLKKTQLDKVLSMKYKDVKYCKNIIGILSQIECPHLVLSNGIREQMENIKIIINLNRIDNFMLFNYGLETCVIGGSILGINENTINNSFRNLPIKSLSDIKVTGIDIMRWLNIKPNKMISEIMGDIKKEILNNNLKNNKNDIRTYVVRKWKHE